MQFNLIFLIVFFFGPVCHLFAQQDTDVEKIKFTTLTRGAHQEVLITKDCVSMVKQGRSDEKEIKIKVKIEKNEWLALLSAVEDISIANIPSYKSPSNKRAYDGAWHSSITITRKDNEAFGHSFDNEEPNEKLEPLMNAIRALVDKAERSNR
jgi:hypothetical protein